MVMIGQGIYSISEAARYTGLQPNRLYAWFRDHNDKPRKLTPSFDVVKGRIALSFLDIVEAKVWSRLREIGLSPKVIRDTYNILLKDWNLSHPFANLKIRTDGYKILVEAMTKAGEPKLLAAKTKRQHFIKPIMDPLLKNLEADENGLATIWRLSEFVVLDPRRNFGAPVIRNTRIPAYIIADSYYASGKNAKAVADDYDLSIAQVRDAVDFANQYPQRSAA
ncbi:MAG: DUF433 domain-containing protein [Planctomycetes bacterium]|nr:DUF433 domain-containing protein [Planctomycetota bacterium]